MEHEADHAIGKRVIMTEDMPLVAGGSIPKGTMGILTNRSSVLTCSIVDFGELGKYVTPNESFEVLHERG